MTGSDTLSIVHAIARLNVGGAALSVLELAAEQRRRGHEVVVVAGTLAAGEESMEYIGDNLGVPVVHLPALQRELSPHADAKAIGELRRTLRRRRPDVLHTHTAKAGATGRVAARLAGRARPAVTVHTFHGHVLRGYFSARRERLFIQVERSLAHHTGALIAVSDEVRDDLVALGVAPTERIEVIPYGFDLSHLGRADSAARAALRSELGLDPESFVVGFAGRLTAIKRPLDLVRTLASLHARGVEGALVVLGDGPDRASSAWHTSSALRTTAASSGSDETSRGGSEDSMRSCSPRRTKGRPSSPSKPLRPGALSSRPMRAVRRRSSVTANRLSCGNRRHLGASRAPGLPRRRFDVGRGDGTSRSGGHARPLHDRSHGRRGRCLVREVAAAMTKVLHVHKITGISGSERHLLTLLPALRARGVDARFLGLDVPGSDAPRFYAALDEAGVPHRSVRCTVDASPRMAVAIIRAIRDERPELVHTHLVHADVYGAAAATLLRVPVVSSRHNDDRYLLGPFRHVDRAFARPARRLIAISDAVHRFLAEAGLPREKLVTVYYGLDRLPDAHSELQPGELGIAAEAPVVLAIGRLTEQKDHPTLLRAFARAHANHPRSVLVILGIGPLEAETRAIVAELGLDGSVLLPGRLEIRDWLERADLFVHTSRWEGFGMVLLEAMLAGLPIVATRVSAVPEVVEDGRTGLLFAPGDDAGIGAAIDTLLSDPRHAKRLGAAGLARARDRFSVERMVDRTMAVYEAATP